MDTRKDTRKDTQKTQTGNPFLSQRHIEIDAFGTNQIAERVYRRIEKIATALLLVTNHVPQTSELKKALELSLTKAITHALDSRFSLRTRESESSQGLLAECRKLATFVRLFTASGAVSLQNAEIIVSALEEAMLMIENAQRSIFAEGVQLSREDLIDAFETPLPLSPARASAPARSSSSSPHASSNGINISRSTDVANPPAGGPHQTVRGEAILRVLASISPCGIRDITAQLPEYSEKMIQRELAELVDQKRVLKNGEKRWSTYRTA